MARQLRKPHGKGGTDIGFIMNKANEIQYDFTLENMQIADNDEILEIGFGNGKFLNKIITKANGIKLSGIDYSRKMVEEASFNNQPLIANNKLRLYNGKSNKMPFPDNSFDKVFCINVVYFWENPQEHINEIYRVLKPGGKFYATIRSEESMQKMPFTKFRFKLYAAGDWQNVLNNSRFAFKKVSKLEEPDFEFGKMPYKVLSLCFEVEK